jgi:hypothetical protein
MPRSCNPALSYHGPGKVVNRHKTGIPAGFMAGRLRKQTPSCPLKADSFFPAASMPPKAPASMPVLWLGVCEANAILSAFSGQPVHSGIHAA